MEPRMGCERHQALTVFHVLQQRAPWIRAARLFKKITFERLAVFLFCKGSDKLISNLDFSFQAPRFLSE